LDANPYLAALKLGVLLADLGRDSEAASYLDRSVARGQEAERSESPQLLSCCYAKGSSERTYSRSQNVAKSICHESELYAIMSPVGSSGEVAERLKAAVC
jgi:hypothetical protein